MTHFVLVVRVAELLPLRYQLNQSVEWIWLLNAFSVSAEMIYS